MGLIPTNAAERAHANAPFVPCIRMFGVWAQVNRGTALSPKYVRETLPVLSMEFDYGAVSRLGRPAERDGCRNEAAEARARALLESLGPIELDCLDHVFLESDSPAQYVVDLDRDPDALCTFSADAIPRLRAAGWQVAVEATYPHSIVQPQSDWIARLDPRDEREDWFDLHLGVDIGGSTVDLLPALLDILERLPASASIDRLFVGRRRFLAIPLEDGSLLPVARDRLRVVLEVLRDLHGEPGRVREATMWPVHASDVPQLAALEAAETSVVSPGKATSHLLAGLALGSSRGEPLDAPRLMNASLRPYQREGVGWLQHLRRNGRGGILADDMGLGKTLQLITHIVIEKLSGRMSGPALVVAPTSLLGNWKREIERFAPHLRTAVLHGPTRQRGWSQSDALDVMITTYAILVRDLEQLQTMDFHVLILDEAQAIKNPRSRAHQAVAEVDAHQRIALSGTPIENNLEELWSLFAITTPGLLGTRKSFQARYGAGNGAEVVGERLEQLRRRIRPFLLRRTKQQVARELPPKTELVVPVELTGGQRDLYESIRLAGHARVRRAVRAKGLSRSTFEILDALTKLRQSCCDPELVPLDAARAVVESAKRTAALEIIQRQLEGGHHVLVFSQFATMLGILSRELKGLGIAHERLDGSTRDRQARIDAFQRGRCDVFLISLKAGGTGLNLTRADTVIHYDPWWNPAAHAQATDRAHRIGQTKPVFVYNLVAAGSVEERMLDLQRRKLAVAEALLTDSDSRSSALSEQDVADLFAPLAGPD